MANTQRPVVPQENPDEKQHRRQLADRSNASLTHDGTNAMTAPLLLKSYAVADLPDASDWTGAAVFVSDETGGATIAVSNGTNWVRTSDLATVS